MNKYYILKYKHIDGEFYVHIFILLCENEMKNVWKYQIQRVGNRKKFTID